MSFERRVLRLRKLLLLAGLGAGLWLGLREDAWLAGAFVAWAGLSRSYVFAAWRAGRALRDPSPYRDQHFELAHPRGWSAIAKAVEGKPGLHLEGPDATIDLYRFRHVVTNRQAMIDSALSGVAERLTVRSRAPVSLEIDACTLEGERVVATTWREAAVIEAMLGTTTDGDTLFVVTARDPSLPEELVRLPLRRMSLAPPPEA